jgi:cardiolipin synthase
LTAGRREPSVSTLPGASAIVSRQRHAPLRVLLLCVASLTAQSLLVGCATIPESPVPEHPSPRLQWSNAHGPLSRQQIAAVYQHLSLEVPNPDALRRHLAIEQAIASSPLYTGNAVHLLSDGAETFPAMFAAIRGAQHSILLEYYIFDNVSSDGQQLLDLLRSKRAEGVNIAVLYDNIGSVSTDDAFIASLRDAGVQLLVFNPVNPLKAHRRWSLNDRDHRKLLIVDQSLAFLGGINLSKDYESSPSAFSRGSGTANWRDTDIKLSGPAVAELEQLFYRNWHSQGGPHLPSEDEPSTAQSVGNQVVHIIDSTPDSPTPRYYATVLSAIDTAEHSVWITAAYFVPTHEERRLLKATARRGVDVRLLLPSQSDSNAVLAVQHAAYEDLLEAGVKVYEREGVILHSKSVVIDQVWSVVGSSNFDHRSVLFNDEVDAVVIGQETALALENLFKSDLRDARAIDLATWKRRSLSKRASETFWRLWTTMM